MVFFGIFLKTLGFLSAIFVFLIGINILFFFSNESKKSEFEMINGDKNSKNIIASMNLNGPIFNSNNNNLLSKNFNNYINPQNVKSILEGLKKINVKVLLVKINSPGGTVSASVELENIFNNFKKETNTKIYFFTNEILASGGYWVATSADKIFASYGSIIGSIGVSGPSWFYYDTPMNLSSGIFGQSIETKKGIEIYNQTAGQGKDLFNPYRRPETKEIDHLQNIVDGIYDDFILKVSNSRKIDISFVKNNIGALIYSSIQAKQNFLVDEVIDYETLIKSIIKENNFNDYKIYELKNETSFIGSFIAKLNTNNDYSYNLICRKIDTTINMVIPLFFKEC